MSKDKTPLYLPLAWANFVDDNWKNLQLDPYAARVAVEGQYSMDEKLGAIYSNPVLTRIFASGESVENTEMRNDIDSFSLVKLWEKNKQVYKFDKDFINELANTETISMTKDLWDYLPYDIIYVDLSDCPEVCKEIIGDGFFVKVEKVNSVNPHYCIHAMKVTKELFFTDVYTSRNEEWECKVDDMKSATDVLIAHNDNELHENNRVSMNGQLYKVLIFQILCYLSSSEPDIEENENTKRTYRRPSPGTAPKNKYSEIQQWDIGVRFGNAFRKWKKERENPNVTPRTSGERAKQRPHSRRAHWSHYWYGSGDNKVRRPKWVASYFVNTEDGQEQNPTTIHQVAPKPNDKGEDT